MGLDPQGFKIGDILKFKADGCIFYGLYLKHYMGRSDYGNGHIDLTYNVITIICFNTGTENNFYDWECEENLTKQREEDER